MDLTTPFTLSALLVGAILIIRQLTLLFFAEQGRKKDLVKRLYHASQDFHLTILIPVSSIAQFPRLRELLSALDEQTYPANRLAIHVGGVQEMMDDLDNGRLNERVQLQRYPTETTDESLVLNWMIQRGLAKGGTDVFVFLKPEDIVKPDFCQNVVSRCFEHPVMQGFVANRQRPESMLGRVLALGNRLQNRTLTAGRFHANANASLLDSGFVVKRDVLEKVPYRRGVSLDNLEYAIRLHLSGFNITWAPNIVVYHDENRSYFDFIPQVLGHCVDRIRCLTAYGIPLILQGILKRRLDCIEDAFALIQPSAFPLALALMISAAWLNTMPVEAWTGPIALNGPSLVTPLLFLTMAVTMIHFFAMMVARCQPQDFITSFVRTPITFFTGVCLSPVVVAQQLFYWAIGGLEQHRRKKHRMAARFNESLDPYEDLFGDGAKAKFQGILDEVSAEQDSPDYVALPQAVREALIKQATAQSSSAATRDDVVQPLQPEHLAPKASPRQPQPQVSPATSTAAVSGSSPHPIAESQFVNDTPPAAQALNAQGPNPIRTAKKQVSLTNGKNAFPCELTLSTHEEPGTKATYQLTLMVKGATFTTNPYRILDQAYYELHTKLNKRGLHLLTCGSCGFFYNPTADVPGRVRTEGACLYGKNGEEINVKADAVSVVSDACPHHCALENREAIVRQWQESLQAARMAPSPDMGIEDFVTSS